MPTSSQTEARWRGRVEAAIRVVEPFLNLVLVIGDRASRLLDREDPDYAPARMARDGEAAPRGLRDHPLARP